MKKAGDSIWLRDTSERPCRLKSFGNEECEQRGFTILARRTGRTIKEVVAMRESHRVALVTPSRRPVIAVKDQRVRLRISIFKPRHYAVVAERRVKLGIESSWRAT